MSEIKWSRKIPQEKGFYWKQTYDDKNQINITIIEVYDSMTIREFGKQGLFLHKDLNEENAFYSTTPIEVPKPYFRFGNIIKIKKIIDDRVYHKNAIYVGEEDIYTYVVFEGDKKTTRIIL